MGQNKGRFIDLSYDFNGQKIPLLSVMMKVNIIYLNDRASYEFQRFKELVNKPEGRKWFKSNTIDKNIKLVERKFKEYKSSLIDFTGDPTKLDSVWNWIADYSETLDNMMDKHVQDMYDGLVEYGKANGLQGMELLAQSYIVDTMFQIAKEFDRYLVQSFGNEIPELRRVKEVLGIQKLEKIHDNKVLALVDFVTNRHDHRPVDFNDCEKVKKASIAMQEVITDPQLFLDGWNNLEG